jgi:hypothetical protein
MFSKITFCLEHSPKFALTLGFLQDSFNLQNVPCVKTVFPYLEMNILLVAVVVLVVLVVVN